jgi:uncharacterized protein (TIGR02266 family)
MSSDRRRHPRVSLEVDVDLSTEHNFYTAKTRDVSMGGLFIASSVGFEPGTRLKLNVVLGKKTHELATRVAWVLNGEDGKPVGFGAEFDGLSANAARAIEVFMKKRDPMQFGMVSEADGEALEDDPADSAASMPPPLPPKR